MLPGIAVAGKARDWQSVCRMATQLGRNVAPGIAKRFFENWFSAYQVTDRESGRPLHRILRTPPAWVSKKNTALFCAAL